ncbi:lytic murein transglycosylase [Hyphomicrobium sp.]|uniref:lytic murein transglycosylase n=1 Tax=Hyphomicrobium sp. TaxID=82 RepID=UPI002CE1A722|nr:lytic murein transglycosylase [Hyphomicrobium sp.]HRN88642.1 lytic murein transglycosylase [Hyphomicrobium sp.]HRQ27758.1 lytic murein transglycosylase [Hyphomicrobium sp.]
MMRGTPFARSASFGLLFLTLLASAAPAAAQARNCGEGAGGFNRWMEGFKQRAVQAGVSPRTANAVLSGITYDARIIRLDRNQKSFKLSFEQFYARRVGTALMNRARQRLKTHRAVLDRIERDFGVPREIVVSIWGLETNFGADVSDRYSIVRSLATLAYDCRRSPFFTAQLTDALRIVDRGYMPAAQMRGGWAGEIGQTQFLPSPYIQFAVDYDGDGRRDLIRSIPDALASTANFLKGHGWQRGQPWGQGTHNYNVLRDWNRAQVYQRTIATMASRLSGR